MTPSSTSSNLKVQKKKVTVLALVRLAKMMLASVLAGLIPCNYSTKCPNMAQLANLDMCWYGTIVRRLDLNCLS